MKLGHLLSVCILLTWCDIQADTGFRVEGHVRDAQTGQPLRNVNVTVQETRRGAVTDGTGYYHVDHLRPGKYTLKFQMIGYKTVRRKIEIKADMVLNIDMQEQSIEFAPIEITPGAVELRSGEPSSSELSSREILSSAGMFSRDIYRNLQVLPGIAHSEWSSKPHIKGGNPDETAVILDNLEIYEPFHLDEIDGPFSIISSDLVRDMQLYTGGFSAKHTDKMSGILRISTIDRITNDSLKLSIDFMGASAVLNQRISDDWSVYTSGRRSYLYVIEKTSGTDYPAEVWDLWTKFDYRMSQKDRFSLSFLVLRDHIQYSQDSTFIRNEFFKSEKTNFYTWANWSHFSSDEHYFITTFGFQRVGKKSDFSFDGSYTDNNVDNRSAGILSLKQDHYLRVNSDHTMEFGVEGKQFLTDYYYREYRLNPTETTDQTVAVDVMYLNRPLDGYAWGAYAQEKWQLTPRISLLYGLRLTGQSYTTGPQLAPRAAVSWNISDRLNSKLAYGWYYQPDDLLKMKVYQNQYIPEQKPEKSIHYVSSLTYSLLEDATASVDLYYKDYRRLNDDFSFDFFGRIEGVGIVDKVYHTRRGSSTGFDLLFKKRYLSYNHISLAYGYGKHRIRNFFDEETSRNLDRTHTVTISNITSLGHLLTVSAVWRYHTGDPFTPSEIRVLGDSSVTDSRLYYVTGMKNSDRLPAFHTLDLRVEKKWKTNQMTWAAYASVINAYNNLNVRQYAWKRIVEDGKISGFRRDRQRYFPRLFLLGLSLELDLPRVHSSEREVER